QGWMNGQVETVLATKPVASTTVVNSSDAGSYTGAITLSTGNDEDYAFTYIPANMTVGKSEQTITFGTLTSKTFGASPVTLTASSTSNLTVSFTSSNTSVATVSGNTVTIVGAGTTIITASQAGNMNFNEAASVNQTLTVGKAAQNITNFAATSSKTFGDASYTLTATGGASGNPVIFTSSDPSIATCTGATGSTVNLIKGGSCTIYANQAGNIDYLAAATKEQTLTVSNSSQTITFAELPDKTFGDAPFNLKATSSSELAITFESSNTAVASISGNTLTITGAGNCTITAIQSGNSNFAAASLGRSLTVKKAVQLITLDPLPVGDIALKDVVDPIKISGSSSSGLPVTISLGSGSTGTLNSNSELINIGKTGNVIINVSQSGNDNYLSATLSQSFDVVKANQTINFNSLDPVTYAQGLSLDLTVNASSGLLVTLNVLSGPAIITNGNSLNLSAAGTVVIAASQAGTDVWNPATEVHQTLLVNKADQNITFDALATKNYGDLPFTLSATGGASGNPVVFTSSDSGVATCTGLNGSILTIIRAGSCNISANQSAGVSYNAARTATRSLLIRETSVELTTTTISEIGSSSATSGGSINSDGGSPITSKSIYWSTSPSMTPKDSASTAGSGTSSFISHMSGLTAGTTYYVKAWAANSMGKSYGNQLSFVPFKLEAMPSIFKTYGNDPFVLNDPTSSSSGAFSYTSSNTEVATISGHTVTIKGAGSATITATQEATDIYAEATTTCTLTVAKANQILTLNPFLIAGNIYTDPLNSAVGIVQLSASSSSGLSVIISLGSGSTGTLNASNQLTNIGKTGNVIVTVTQAGNKDFQSASISQTFDVTKANQIITFNSLQSKAFGSSNLYLSATASSNLQVT
ncbi:MAG: Ig-like domain-containing protein, partial [Prolixibacteraceae bacterium]